MALLRREPEPTNRAFAPPPQVGTRQRVGISETTQPSAHQLLIETKSWQAIAARAIARSIGRLEPRVFRVRRTGPGQIEEIELDDHPLTLLLEKPNPFISRNQLHRVVSMWLTQVGDGYLLKVTDGLGVVRELWPLVPSRMELVWDPAMGLVGYVYSALDGSEIPYRRDEVIRFWDPDPNEPFAAMGNLGPQATEYDAAKFIDETVRQHYRDDASPKAALESAEFAAPPPEIGTEEFDRWVRQWRQNWHQRSGAFKGVPVPLPPGVSLKELTNASATQDPAVAAFYRDQILMANGVPRSILGDVVDANRASAETNKFVFESETIAPQAELMSDAYTLQLADVDFGDDIRVGWKDFITGDKLFELQQEGQDLTLKVRNINEVRTMRNEPSVEWGEDPVGSFGDTPYRPNEEPDSVDDPGAFGGGGGGTPGDAELVEDVPPTEKEPPVTPPKPAGRANRMGLVRRFESMGSSAETIFVPAGRRAMVRIFKMQRKALVDALEREGSTIEVPDSRIIKLQLAAGIRKELDELIEVALSDEVWNAVFGREFGPVRGGAYGAGGQQTLDTLSGGTSFEFLPHTVDTLATQGAELVQNVNDTTKQRLRKTLSEGQAKREGIDQLTARVRKTFKTRAGQAETISRTEVLKANSAGQLQGFRLSGVVAAKQWFHVTSGLGDPHAREMHIDLANDPTRNVVGVDDPFHFSDGVQADAPGVGVGGPLPAEHAINCRCFVVPVL